MIDNASLDELRARIPVSEVVGQRVRLTRVGREWKGLSPFTNERTPSLFVNDAKRFWHDFSSGKHGDIFTFIMEAEGVTFPEAVEQMAAMAGLRKPAPSTTSRLDTSTSSGEWLQLWDDAVHSVGTPVDSYLRLRNVPLLEEAAGEAIRFHPACKFGLRRVSCMLALVRNIRTNAPQAIHRTALDTAGNKIEIDGTDRMMLGAVGGGAVKLSPDDTVTTRLGIGEGIESTLALRLAPQFGASPVWAVLSAGQIEKFPVLAGIECLWIAVDHDKNSTGQRAAMACSIRWTAAGQEVFRVIPKALGNDLNDLARRAP